VKGSLPQSDTGPGSGGIRIVELIDATQLEPLPRFERSIWGEDTDAIPLDLLVAFVHVGGLALGAVDTRDRLVGAAVAFPAAQPGVLHSHYCAVAMELRGHGVGRQLKLAQREWAARRGYRAIQWTYDPMQVANAHFNLTVLGAVGVEYHQDFYGVLRGINGTLPSDRVLVEWPCNPPQERSNAGEAPTVLVDFPIVDAADIARSTPEALEARLTLRDGLRRHLHDGWKMVGVHTNRVERTASYQLGR
jgi:predicted GNAT superfamily acetyltransferase